MKKLFTVLLIFSFIFYQIPVFAEDETAPDTPPVSSEASPEDESEENAPPSEEEEKPPGGEELPPEEEAPPEGEPGDEPPPEDDTGEEITPDITADLTALTELMEQNFSLMYEEVSTIRKNTDIIIYFVVPVLCAILLICKLGLWFYGTFIKDAL